MELTPKQLEEHTGLSVINQRAWEREGLLGGWHFTTPGGHRRYRPISVVQVATVKALNDRGHALADAAALTEVILKEIIEEIESGRDEPENGETPLFLWRDVDSRSQKTTIDGHRSSTLPSGFFAIRLNDLRRIPSISKAGGIVLFPRSLASKLPERVKALVRETH